MCCFLKGVSLFELVPLENEKYLLYILNLGKIPITRLLYIVSTYEILIKGIRIRAAV